MTQLGFPMASDRRERRHRRRGHLAVVLAALLVAGLIGGAWYGGRALLHDLAGGPPDYSGAGGAPVRVEVNVGDSLSAIGRTLAADDVVKSAQAFIDAASGNDRAASLQPGYYILRKQMKASGALALMLDPSSRAQARVTVPEGLRVEETVALLAKATGIPVADFNRALANPAALGLPAYAHNRVEGYLFPATYDIEPDATATSVLKDMVTRFGQAARDVGLDDGPLPPQQLVVLASLLEVEARHSADYGKVARVVYNRLAHRPTPMRLQLDSTLHYALHDDKRVLTDRDKLIASPYNTYRILGLPPGAIDSPGEETLLAAKNPTPGPWLYFVTTNLKTAETKFTASYAEFLKFKMELKANS